MRHAASATLGLFAALLASTTASAQDLEPRAYANAPVGLNVVAVNFSDADGEVGTDASLPLQDAKVESRAGVLGYVRTLGVFGRAAKLGLILPYVSLSGSARVAGEIRERSVDGLGDPRLRLAVNLYGAPALSLEEFRAHQPGFVLGTSLLVTAPLGRYDSDKLLNIGSNRWSFKPEIGLSKTWGRPLTTEVTAGASFFTDNRDFLGMTREQDPLYALQGHVIYRFGNGVWTALDGTYYSGGRTTVDGRRSNDRQGNSRAGITVSVPIARQQSIQLHASTGVAIRTGGDFDLIGISWLVQWSDD